MTEKEKILLFSYVYNNTLRLENEVKQLLGLLSCDTCTFHHSPFCLLYQNTPIGVDILPRLWYFIDVPRMGYTNISILVSLKCARVDW